MVCEYLENYFECNVCKVFFNVDWYYIEFEYLVFFDVECFVVKDEMLEVLFGLLIVELVL